MLESKVIVFDDSCPMCRLYTYGFVAFGLLKAENRIGFATAPLEVTSQLDLNRARHEIPLFDRSTHETIYGLRAMTTILASRWPWMNPIFDSRPFAWFFHPLYQIITYNRRVIAGCKACCGFDCAPDLNRFYRSVYLGLVGTVLATSAGGLLYTATMSSMIGAGMIAALLIVGLLVGSLKRMTGGSLVGWNYAGNYATVLAIVAIVLCPLVLFSVSAELAGVNLFVALLLGLEEIRRREL